MIRLLHYFYTIKALTGSLLSEIKLSKANKKQRHWLNIYQWLKEIAKWIPLSLVQNETHTEFTNTINGFTLIAAEVTLKWRPSLMQLPLYYPIQQTQLQTHSASKVIWAPGLTNLNSLVLKRSSRLFSHFMNFITLNCIERHCSFGCTPIIGKTRMSSIFCGSRFLVMNYPFLKYM